MSCSVGLAALPGTFDYAPQHLWERAIIARIGKRDAASRTHDWADDLADGYGRH
jgi:hypothetical protein